MHTRYTFTALNVILVTACLIAMPSCSSRLTAAPDDGFRAQMQQEIIQALQEVVPLYEQQALFVEKSIQQPAVFIAMRKKWEANLSLDLVKAKARIPEARLRLAVAQHQPDVAIEEFRNIIRIQEERLRRIEARVKERLALSIEVAQEKIQFLEERIRLATTIRDM